MDKKIFKKSPEELQGFLQFRKRGHKVRAKKGKDSWYNRQEFKKQTAADSSDF